MHNYKLSIIIPTKNRQYYCLYAVKQILTHGWNQVEICIQDNSDNNALESDIHKLGAENIVYNYHPGILSFVDNFSEAVSLAHGDYICMIGDDDGILPDILSLVEDMERQTADAAIPSLNFIYFWPSEKQIVKNSEKGMLVSHLYREHHIVDGKKVDNHNAVVKLLRNGVQNYTDLDMPRLYHGIVRKDVLKRIKDTAGTYFGGLTPDMYMATALSLVCQNVIRVDYSVTISGICSISGSSDSATGKHTGELSQAPHFRGHDNYKWDELIPAFYSVDTIWADTLLHTLRDFNRVDLITQFNKSIFAGICLEKYPEYRNLILKHFIGKGCTVNSIKWSLFKNKFDNLLNRVQGRIKRAINNGIGTSTTKTYEIPNIIDVDRIISELKESK